MAFRSVLRLTAAVLLAGQVVAADGLSGSYLAARQAGISNDFDVAADYYTRALIRDPGNPRLMESAVQSFLALGKIDRALPIAQRMTDEAQPSQLAAITVIAGLIRAGEFDTVINRLESGQGIGPLVDGLTEAWAHVGAGQMTEALARFDAVAAERGLRGFALYHKALALASVGDFEGAETIYSGEDAGLLTQTRRGAMARMEVLSQLGRGDQALETLDRLFGQDVDPELEAMRGALQAGETLPFTHIGGASDGVAEVFFSVAGALNRETSDDYTLIYTRVAEYLRPDHIDALLLSANLLERMSRYALATETYKRVPRDHPAFHAAELGRAEALRSNDKPDTAIEVLEQLTQTHGDLPVVFSTLGDHLRQQDRFEEAIPAYDQALGLYETEEPNQWFVHYARGVAFERTDRWDQAEADFRRALELNPDQPQVLNYLGYSLVEKQIKLDEALDMIERAVAARPESGYIVDSLGWVLFRLGRYEESVVHMERAAELLPIDPIVNDHLGDVYWAVGRIREAEFQWRRALSFVDYENASGDADPDRIRRKLDVGLDAVLDEEGAPPLVVANDDG